jgi:hypothetical protein
MHRAKRKRYPMSNNSTFNAASYLASTGINDYTIAVYGCTPYPNPWEPAPSQPWYPGDEQKPTDIEEDLLKSSETLENSIFSSQRKALVDVQLGNITRAQFFEVMRLSFKMLDRIRKEAKKG